MRLPVIPIVVAVVLLGGATVLLTTSGRATLVLDAPVLTALANVPGVETEVAVAPDGFRYAVIASGDLWLWSPDGDTKRLTNSIAAESAPSWNPDETTVTVTRGSDTFAIDLRTGEESLYRQAATDLEWAPDGRVAFVRGGALWIADSAASEGREIVPAEAGDALSVRSPRFSPDGTRLLYLKSLAGLRGQVWIAHSDGSPPMPLIADRIAENPTSAEWVNDQHVVYLTDRSGGIAVWYFDIEGATMVPLTLPLMSRSLAPLKLDVHEDRIVVPRHTVDSRILTSEGREIAASSTMEFEPAASTRGNMVAYTVGDGDRFEIWIASSDGTDARYITLGQHPRFAPNGNEVVYSNTDLDGNRDVWKVDIRTGIPVRLTDDPGMDDTPDWSPDGRTILFASERDGTMSLWTVPPAGGQRLEWNDGGYAPRFSPDGSRVVFWNDGEIRVARADGSGSVALAPAPTPTFAAWSGEDIVYVREGRIVGGVGATESTDRVLPVLDRLPNGEWIFAGVRDETTELLAIDLTFREE